MKIGIRRAGLHELRQLDAGAIAHHGGTGTTQSATLAGTPSIVVANIAEQEHWGGELRRRITRAPHQPSRWPGLDLIRPGD